MNQRIAINGFGPIARLVFSHLLQSDEFEIVALNDGASLDAVINLATHDAMHAGLEVSFLSKKGRSLLRWQDREVLLTSVEDSRQLPWRDLQVDLVIEASGVASGPLTSTDHLHAGANHVIVEAPVNGADLTICAGINADQIDADRHLIIANALPITNCVAPIASVLDEEFGIESGVLTGLCAPPVDRVEVQVPEDGPGSPESATVPLIQRDAAITADLGDVLADLANKLDGVLSRAPAPKTCLVDFVIQTEQPSSVERVNETLRKAAETDRLDGILAVSDDNELLVVGSTYSALIPADCTTVVRNHTAKVMAWYDSQCSTAQRILDLVSSLAANVRRPVAT
ncbi:MAG: glyceraldehyde 3-phosphate dehydrogenase NAD-binding domain-containing protein [Gemmatimonadales bacterium]|jgi:glyceraldehyde 3-phosphate dehydrogenase